MKLYLIRHGESESNAKGVMAGSGVDSPLTDKGKTQAVEVAKKLSAYTFDYVIVSPLKRTRETAEIICSLIGRESTVDYDARLREFNVGAAEGMRAEEYHRLRKEGYHFDGSETLEEIYERVNSFLDELRLLDAENVLLVSHNGTGRMIRLIATQKEIKDFHDIPKQGNDEVLIVEV